MNGADTTEAEPSSQLLPSEVQLILISFLKNYVRVPLIILISLPPLFFLVELISAGFS